MVDAFSYLLAIRRKNRLATCRLRKSLCAPYTTESDGNKLVITATSAFKSSGVPCGLINRHSLTYKLLDKGDDILDTEALS